MVIDKSLKYRFPASQEFLYITDRIIHWFTINVSVFVMHTSADGPVQQLKTLFDFKQ